MKLRNVLYVVIGLICVFAVGFAVYYQIFMMDEEETTTNTQIDTSSLENKDIDLEKVKIAFNNLFTNEFYKQEYEIPEATEKLNINKDYIYAAYEIQKEEDSYSINVNIPLFNIKSDEGIEINKTTQKIFADKVNEILKKQEESDVYVIYNIDFVAYLNDNILSLVIKSTLKEGKKAQRVMVQTYNYDIKKKEIPTFKDILKLNDITDEEAEDLILEQVTYAYNKSKAVSTATSQSIYNRDLDSKIYQVENIKNFFIGENGKIYVVYAYGNSNYTSEMDIIEF